MDRETEFVLAPDPRHPNDSTRPAPSRRRATDLLRSWQPTPLVATVAVAATAIGTAFASFFARRLTDDGISSVAVAFFRFAIVAAVLVPMVAWDRPRRSATIWGIGSGAAMGLGWIAYVHAVEHGAVATVGVVYMTFPLFTLVVARVVFGVRPAARSVAGGALVLVAAVVALGAPGGGVPLTAVLAPATFGFSIAVLTERLGALDPFERLGAVALGAVGALVPLLVTMEPAAVVPRSVEGWLWVVGIGVGCALVPMLIYASAAPSVGAAGAALAGSAELPTVFVIGAVFFGEAITAGQFVAGGLVVAAIVATARGGPRRSGRTGGRRPVGVGPRNGGPRSDDRQSVEMPPSTGTTAPVV